jgi:hypothetical protein
VANQWIKNPLGSAGLRSCTDEDVVILATAQHDDGRLLVVRHLPDRGTVELGWWARDEDGTVTPEPSVLELAAEAVEVDAVVRLCTELAEVGWATAEEDRTAASSRLPPMMLRSWPCAPGAA